MQTTVIYAHPYEGSFNHAVKERVVETLRQKGEACTLIDLYADGFNPAMSREDLKLYAEGATTDPLVTRYNEILDITDRVILIYPQWWYDMPAILRGFLDKVMLNGSAWYADAAGMHAIRNIPKTLLLTTSSSPTEEFIEQFGDPVNTTMISATLRFIGFNGATWHNLGGIDTTTDAKRTAWLDTVSALL